MRKQTLADAPAHAPPHARGHVRGHVVCGEGEREPARRRRNTRRGRASGTDRATLRGADRRRRLLVVPIIIVEQSSPGEPWSTLAAVGNWLVWLLFLAEVVVMLAVVPNRGRWLRAHPLEVAIVVLTPPFLPASLQALRVFRLLRLLRLIAAVRYARRLFTLDGLRYGALIALITAFVGGAAFAHAEGEEVSTWDGVWWAVTTMTTVGYGDLYPSTDTGRAVAIVVMVVGIGFLSLLIGSVSERFLAAGVEEEVAEAERELEGEVDAAKVELVAELRAIGERLRQLEAQVERAGR